MKKKYYAIRKGRKSGIVVTSWDDCRRLVEGYSGAIFKGFTSWQEKEALQFAKSGDYGEWTPKVKQEKSRKDINAWDGEKYPCIKRGDYYKNGVFYKNRCILRQGPRLVGINYIPSEDTGCPF